MRFCWLLPLVMALSVPAAAEDAVADAKQQCPMLISQVESRLQSSPPQDQESVARARDLLEQARQAEEEGDYKTCMSKIREAFKFLNKT